MSESSIKENIKNNRKAISNSRFGKNGETEKKAKLSSKNFDKLMKQRGINKEDAIALKSSFDRSRPMQVRHAKKGEKFTVTHGTQNSSGIFVSKKSLGKTAEKRIDKGALPHTNSAKFETKVVLDKNQNLVYGKIAPQSKFQKLDPKQKSRSGGGTQVITDGGYKSGAIRNNDTKYPVLSNKVNLSASQKFRDSISKDNKTKSNKTSNTKTHSNGR